MCMHTLSEAWKVVCAISVLVLMFQPLATAQQAGAPACGRLFLDQKINGKEAIKNARRSGVKNYYAKLGVTTQS